MMYRRRKNPLHWLAKLSERANPLLLNWMNDRRQEIERHIVAATQTLQVVPIPWTADAMINARGQHSGAYNEEKARANGTPFWRDHADIDPKLTPLPNFNDYDVLAVQCSGGKDSVACLLVVLRLLRGHPELLKRVELWHQDVDGNGAPFMDWPVTRAYVEALGKLFHVPVVMTFREGGFYGELMRGPNEKHGRKMLELEDGKVVPIFNRKLHEIDLPRQRWPAIQADLNIRWCTGQLKIEVAKAMAGRVAKTKPNVLLISGERAEESRPRSHYHRGIIKEESDRRKVHQLRIVYDYSEQEVWDELALAFPGKGYGIQAHPAYEVGWSRCSCAGCIFSSPQDWARLKQVLPEQYQRIVDSERTLNRIAQERNPEEAKEKARLVKELKELNADKRRIEEQRDLEIARYDEDPKRSRSMGIYKGALESRFREELAENKTERKPIIEAIDNLNLLIGRNMRSDGSIPELVERVPKTELSEYTRFWLPYVRGEKPWTVECMLRGPNAPVFRHHWELPPGATNERSSGPPT